MKRKLSRWVKKFLNADAIKMAILFVPLVYLLIKEIGQGEFVLSSFLDVDILVSFLFLAICELIAGALGHWLGSKCEDATKLTEDYRKLCKKYPREAFMLLGEEKCPVLRLYSRKKGEKPFSFEIIEKEPGKRYELPGQVAEHSDEIMNAHRYSKIHNNRNIRLDDIKKDGNKISLFCSDTMYFDSMVTNRAMDYEWENGKTVREIYEPGPFLSPLCESKLSNHLGFNGFIETSDDKLIFVKRYGKVSIGKGTLANSIGAAMKTKYCLDDEKRFTKEGLGRAIRKEIEDELKLKIEIDNDEAMCNSIFAFYRDVVEGGKPQFLFYYKVNQSSEKVKEDFKAGVRTDKKKRRKEEGTFLTDGKKLVFIPTSELSQLVLEPGSLKRKGGWLQRKYKMMPSAVASVELLKEYLGEKKK